MWIKILKIWSAAKMQEYIYVFNDVSLNTYSVLKVAKVVFWLLFLRLRLHIAVFAIRNETSVICKRVFSSWNPVSYFSFSSNFSVWVSHLELPNLLCKRYDTKTSITWFLLCVFEIKGEFRLDAKQREATQSNQNLTSSTARERLRPLATFASNCATALACRL